MSSMRGVDSHMERRHPVGSRGQGGAPDQFACDLGHHRLRRVVDQVDPTGPVAEVLGEGGVLVGLLDAGEQRIESRL
jgi:hypothetical protein